MLIMLVITPFYATYHMDARGDAPGAGDMRWEFILFSIHENGPITYLDIHAENFPDEVEFLRTTLGIGYDEVRHILPSANSACHLYLRALMYDGSEWAPINASGFRVYVGNLTEPVPEESYVRHDGVRLEWTTADISNGSADMEVLQPDVIGEYYIVFEIDRGNGWERMEYSCFKNILYRPKQRIDYIVYGIRTMEPGRLLTISHHTYEDNEQALQVLNESGPLEYDRVMFDVYASPIRNHTVEISYATFFEDEVVGGWVPNANALVTCYILEGNNDKFEPYRVIESFNNTSDGNGRGTMGIRLPFTLGLYQIYLASMLSDIETQPRTIPGSDWNFSTRPAPSITIGYASILTTDILPGDFIRIEGRVTYLYSGTGVAHLNISVEGDLIPTTYGTTAPSGDFYVLFQSPIIAGDDHSVRITAIDEGTWETANTTLTYSVEDDTIDPDDDDGLIPAQFAPLLLSSILLAAIILCLVRRRVVKR